MTRSLHVVLVEDNDALRLATSVILVQAGFEVSGVACAEDVDDLPTARVPDLYVIDVNLPGEDGFSLAARLRRARPWVGIVITTARIRVDDRVHGYEQGVDVYLPKPVNPPELLSNAGWQMAAPAHRPAAARAITPPPAAHAGGSQCPGPP
jgi:DNA-binding response OmpR family regulator